MFCQRDLTQIAYPYPIRLWMDVKVVASRSIACVYHVFNEGYNGIVEDGGKGWSEPGGGLNMCKFWIWFTCYCSILSVHTYGCYVFI